MASEEEDQDLESLRVAVLASLKPKSQQASPSTNDANSQGIAAETGGAAPPASSAAAGDKTEDAEEEEEQDEDALRRAALKSTKEIRLEDIPPPLPPQPTFQSKGNLIAIQPVPEEPPSASLNSNERPKLPRSNKFARFASSSSESSSDDDNDSSEGESGDEEIAKTGHNSDSSKGSSSSGDESSSSSGASSRSSGSSSRSSSSSSSSSSSVSSSSSSDSDSGDSDRKQKPKSKSKKHMHSSGGKRRDGERRNKEKERGLERKSERSRRDRSQERLRISPGKDRRRDSRGSRQRTSNVLGDDQRDYRSGSGRPTRDSDRLRTRSRSPQLKVNERGLRTRPDGTRGFGPGPHSRSLESRLRRLAAHESDGDWNRNARESATGRSRRSVEKRKESTGRRRSSLVENKNGDRADGKPHSPKPKQSNSDSDSNTGSDISLSDLESESDKETSRFKHAKSEKPPNELDVHPRSRQVSRSYRERPNRDNRDNRHNRRREDNRRRDIDSHRDDGRYKDNKTRLDLRDRAGLRKHDTDKQRESSNRSRNGPTSVINPKTVELNTKKEPIPSLLDIKIPKPSIDAKTRPDLSSTFRREPKSTIRDRVGEGLTSPPGRLKDLEKRFESESESDGEKVPTGPRSVVKMDKRRDLKSRLGVRAPANKEQDRQKRDKDDKHSPEKMTEKDRRQRRSLEPRDEDARSKITPDVKDLQMGDGNPKIHITFNEVPPSKRKPIHERLGLKEAAGSKPRRSVKDRLGKKIPTSKDVDSNKRPKHSLPGTYGEDDLLEDRQHVKIATKPRQSVIELKTQTKRDAERKRQAEKNKKQMEEEEDQLESSKSEQQKEDRKHLEDDKKTEDPEISQEKRQDTDIDGKQISAHTTDEDVCETKEEKQHSEENDQPKTGSKGTDSKPRNKIKLKRRSSQEGQKDHIGAKDKYVEMEDTRVYSSSKKEDDIASDNDDVIRSISPERNVVTESDKPRRNVLSSESNISDRQIIYSSLDKSARNVIPGDSKKSKRRIIHEDSEMLEQLAAGASHRKIVRDDSSRSRRKVYQMDSSRRKIVHDSPPRRKILEGDYESSRRNVFQSDLGSTRRTIVKQDMKRGPSPTSSFEDIRRAKLSRGGELWRRDCIEEQSREVEIRMEKEERKVIEETKEAEAKRLKEEALLIRIQKIKAKNAAILQRHQEIEAEKKMFGS